jgi:colanic acid/amylovoran biosynthesis glycosyltransferase
MSRFAYFFSQFPSLTTTFIQREIRAANHAGCEALLIATKPPAQRSYHPHDNDLRLRTRYLAEQSIGAYIKAHWYWCARSPRRYMRALMFTLKLNDDFAMQKINNIKHFIVGGLLAYILYTEGFSHVHVHFAFGAASIALFAKMISGITYSVSIHGSDVLLPRPLTCEKLHNAQEIISNCLFHIQNLRNRYPVLDRQTFSCVRLGLALRREPWHIAPLQEINGPLRILTVGRLLPVKAQHLLIEACSYLRSDNIAFECRIIGEGPLREELAELIKKFGLEGAVILVGPCFEEQVVAQYEWAHVVVLSSQSEGTPMTLIEGMAKGRLCIAPAITAIPELIDDGITGLLFEKGNAHELFHVFLMCAQHRELLTEMGNAGRRKAEQLFDIDTNTKMLFARLEFLFTSSVRKNSI